jgi:hypothetical protein
MTPLEQQFEVLRTTHGNSELHRLPDGSHLILVPKWALPPGWSKSVVDVRFVAPVGYPMARPDCFWADADLRLANGNVPQATGNNALPHVAGQFLWFSWHVASWNPNSDNLLTYLHVIKRRLHDPR